jgi:hypothetical protein
MDAPHIFMMIACFAAIAAFVVFAIAAMVFSDYKKSS